MIIFKIFQILPNTNTNTVKIKKNGNHVIINDQLSTEYCLRIVVHTPLSPNISRPLKR